MKSFKEFNENPLQPRQQFFNNDNVREMELFTNPPNTYEELRSRMNRVGYRNLGSGAFASAYFGQQGGDIVLRVWRQKDAWTGWANAIRAFNNPHVPRIYHLHEWGKNGSHGGWAMLEKLEFGNYTKLASAAKVANIFESDPGGVVRARIVDQGFELTDRRLLDLWKTIIWDWLRKRTRPEHAGRVFSNRQRDAVMAATIKVHPQLEPVYKLIIDETKKIRGSFTDIHFGNCAVRGNDFVYTDPIAKFND